MRLEVAHGPTLPPLSRQLHFLLLCYLELSGVTPGGLWDQTGATVLAVVAVVVACTVVTVL
jgi:hypothetical protein